MINSICMLYDMCCPLHALHCRLYVVCCTYITCHVLSIWYVYANTSICMCIHTCAYIRTCMHMRMYVRTCLQIYLNTHNIWHACIHIHTHGHSHIYVHVYLQMYWYIRTYVRMYPTGAGPVQQSDQWSEGLRGPPCAPHNRPSWEPGTHACTLHAHRTHYTRICVYCYICMYVHRCVCIPMWTFFNLLLCLHTYVRKCIFPFPYL